MKKNGLKRSALAMAAAVLVFSLAACGGSSEETTAAAETEAAAEADTEAAETEASEDEEGGSRLDAILDAGVITMATSPDFAPYEFEDISSGTTEYAGADVELGKYIAEQLGVELQIEAMEDGTFLLFDYRNRDPKDHNGRARRLIFKEQDSEWTEIPLWESQEEGVL